MRKLVLAVAFACAVTVAITGSAGASAASQAVGYVYVNDNTAGANSVAGFARSADGTITPLAGSPFTAGGSGTGQGIASQGALQLSSNGRYVLAVDAGSNQISVLAVEQGGTLQLVGSPVSSNGVDPVSIATNGSLVYVANAGATDSNYTGFTLSPAGQLAPLAGSTVALPNGSQPGDVLFSSDGRKFVGTRVATSLIDSFTVGANGLLTAAPGSPFTPQGYGPFGSDFRPGNDGQLFVTNAHTAAATPAPGSISAFTDAANGVLTPTSGSPYANDGIASCWVEVNPAGTYLFTVNTASATVSSYAIAANGSLTFLHSTPMAGAVKGPEDARISPDGKSLFVVDPGPDELSSFAVNDGNLSELGQSPTHLPAGAAPAGVVVTETNLQGLNLQGADLAGANLPDANVQGSNLQNADLAGANLQDANLQGSNLQRLDGAGADFADATLQGANLQAGTFTHADFAGAFLQGANLQGDDFTGANLAGAEVAGANLQNITWSNTICPDGTNSTTDGGSCLSHL